MIQLKGILAIIGVWGFIGLIFYNPEAMFILLLAVMVIVGTCVIYDVATDDTD